MKRISILLVCIIVFTANILSAHADGSPTLGIELSKSTYDNSVFINAEYNCGIAEMDAFVKKAWFRVDLLEGEFDLYELYTKNCDKLKVLENNQMSYRLNVTLNGTYIFCGWTGDVNTAPNCIEPINVSEVQIERPMGNLTFNVFGDYSQDIIANAFVTGIDCKTGTEIKRYALMKNYELPPGSWPGSLPPDVLEEVYDEIISEKWKSFAKSGLEIIPDEKGFYSLKHEGGYILFLEDSSGRYKAEFFFMPTAATDDVNAPNILYNMVYQNNEHTEGIVEFKITDNTEIAKVEWVPVTDAAVGSSQNNTDEFFLSDNSNLLTTDKLEITGEIIVRAIDTSGNARYSRVVFGNPELHIYKIDDMLNINIYNVNVTGISFVALYDKNNVFLTMLPLQIIETNNLNRVGYSVYIPDIENTSKAKVFFIKDFESMRPLAKTDTITM